MSLPVTKECPFGAKCERAEEGKIIRCAWFVNVLGTHPQTGQAVDQWRCCVDHLSLLTVEIIRNLGGAQAATESLRNQIAEGTSRVASPLNGLLELAKERRIAAASNPTLLSDVKAVNSDTEEKTR